MRNEILFLLVQDIFEGQWYLLELLNRVRLNILHIAPTVVEWIVRRLQVGPRNEDFGRYHCHRRLQSSLYQGLT
jgi:hypothetical protein